jgi:hypothetical protein
LNSEAPKSNQPHLETLEGCCETAGSFGYEQGHYEVSQACGERMLFPAVRGTAPDDLVVAPGFSRRHQIADFCDNRRSLHTAELLAMAGTLNALGFLDAEGKMRPL